MRMVVVIMMVMVVDILLLYATGHLLGGRIPMWRYGVAGLAGGIFAGLSMIDGFSFLGSSLWQICGIVMTGLLAFGFSGQTLRKLFLFSLLRLSIGGLAGKEAMVSMLLGALGIGFACMIVGRRSKFVPVELNFHGQTYHITALYDTGNALKDPITGRGVLVVDANIARRLTGLEAAALRDPVQNLLSFPGLRLIPYQSVGNTGFLLALQITDAKIGNRQESILVALSPNLLSNHYQALTGGNL